MVIAIGMVIVIVGSTLEGSVSVATSSTKFSYAVKELGTLGGKDSIARAINNAGQVVGSSETSNGEYHPVLWDKGNKIDLVLLAVA
jgi:probable HAF family extracellular repeat protein